MCGIFGQFSLRGADPALIERMARALAHRGPDGYSLHVDDGGQFAFGAGRLAIIDLTAPPGVIFSEDRRVSVAFNGEIYNHADLRAELVAHGHVFSTRTDTEVIVHGYEQWGDGVIERLRGMFAVCIWDADHQRAILARDRLGEKPLYVAQVGDQVLFASEVKAILQSPEVPRRVSPRAVPQFMILGYVTPPDTMFDGIEKLAPGERLIIERDGDHIRVDRSCYWTPTVNPAQKDAPPYADTVKTVRAAVDDAVEMQMMSDVPIGAFLSGGVDSTAVVALMRQHTSEQVRTFTVGFDVPPGSKEDAKFNVDARYAADVSSAFGTQQHLIRIRQNEGLSDVLPHLIYSMDDLIAMPTIIQTAFVAALARSSGVPVLLNGEAGDELFMGYEHYRADQVVSRYLRLPTLLRQGVIEPLVLGLPNHPRLDSARKLIRKAHAPDPAARYLEWMRVVSPESFKRLIRRSAALDSAIASHALKSYLDHPTTPYYTDRLAYTNLKLYVGENSNMRMDKMCMAMSIEARSPLEDFHLAEMALNLPMAYKLRNGDFKRVFKDAVRDLVPADVLTRPKWGFNPPASEWLRTALLPLVNQFLTRERIEAAGIFDADAVAGIIHAHVVERRYEMWALWNLLIFHIWYALFIDGSFTLSHTLTPADLLDPALSSVG